MLSECYLPGLAWLELNHSLLHVLLALFSPHKLNTLNHQMHPERRDILVSLKG